jgi:hypothetical protein
MEDAPVEGDPPSFLVELPDFLHIFKQKIGIYGVSSDQTTHPFGGPRF